MQDLQKLQLRGLWLKFSQFSLDFSLLFCIIVYMKHKKCLLLNQDFTPICLISWKKAIYHAMSDKLMVVDYYENDFAVTGSNHKFPIPAVLVCRKFIKNTNKTVKYSKLNLFIRDNFTCSYCGKRDTTRRSLTVDHIIPKSRWGKLGYKGSFNHWNNLTTCCFSCNTKKGDRLLQECGMKLRRNPFEPTARQIIKGIKPDTRISEEWKRYLPEAYS
jgi:5-methylcytosine-specific restriction endonuclease McrA